ncbi:alpha/beta fold hydrolase [Arthrobacter sp. I2-34]|uniref:Alpha/beta fold hydrolase n=1 Tax=Arthrobacter hankyongi TaxID=2904801 RepID=A0ABS9L4A3_9MICC|nr:alpha/beta hydrolase [Arthrobacter hankyongi]MCG2621497.1 alpha/beta fold hydrolase [Arthrobacter hankyongi]
MRVSSMEWQCLSVEGREFRIETRGSGPDRFVLVPGIGMSPRYFVPLVRELASTATVHAVHLPGFGAARRPVQALPIPETGRLAAQALQQLRPGRFIVVGHSMGCQVGVEMALADPASVRSLVLLGPAINSRERTIRLQRRRLIQDTFREPAMVTWTAVGDYLRCGRRWYLANAEYMIGHRLEERLPLVRVPVVLVRGEHDPIVPRSWLTELAAAGTTAVAVEVPGEAHAAMYRNPAAVARHCRELAARS